jgi:hypothetical protein
METSYSDLIIPPKYSTKNIKQNMNEINEYKKILNGEKSKKMPNVDAPVGKVYVYDTGSMCTDVKTGLSIPRHTIVNEKTSKKNTLLASAYADFETAKTDPNIDIDPTATNNDANKCMTVNVKETGINGKKTVNEKKNITIAEYRRTSPDFFAEGFISPDKVTSDNYMKHMDAGQRFFVGTVAVLGLYMYHQLLFGKRV